MGWQEGDSKQEPVKTMAADCFEATLFLWWAWQEEDSEEQLREGADGEEKAAGLVADHERGRLPEQVGTPPLSEVPEKKGDEHFESSREEEPPEDQERHHQPLQGCFCEATSVSQEKFRGNVFRRNVSCDS